MARSGSTKARVLEDLAACAAAALLAEHVRIASMHDHPTASSLSTPRPRGGDVGRITIVPLGDPAASSADERAARWAHAEGVSAARRSYAEEESAAPANTIGSPAVRAVINQFEAFDASKAQCYLPGDKQMILGMIETGIGSVDAFNKVVRTLFAEQPHDEELLEMQITTEPSSASGRRTRMSSTRRINIRASISAPSKEASRSRTRASQPSKEHRGGASEPHCLARSIAVAVSK